MSTVSPGMTRARSRRIAEADSAAALSEKLAGPSWPKLHETHTGPLTAEIPSQHALAGDAGSRATKAIRAMGRLRTTRTTSPTRKIFRVQRNVHAELGDTVPMSVIRAIFGVGFILLACASIACGSGTGGSGGGGSGGSDCLPRSPELAA